jgi:hypothetical protein
MRALLAIVLAMAGGTLACRQPAPPPAPAPVPAPPPVVEAEPVVLPEPEPPDEQGRPDAAPETVTIKLIADQRKQAHVFWGRKDLGVAPLELTRPRGSGPLDLLVMADGYLPLHTRVFTDRNETLALRLYAPAEASGLPGYSPPAPSSTAKSVDKNPGIKPTTGPRNAHP